MDERENTLTYKAAREREIKEVLVQTEIEKERTGFVFRQLHSFLEEQEKLLLAEIEETQEEIARSGDEEIAKLSRELSSLAGAIQELQEKSQQPEDELLPDICSILDRCEMDPSLEPVAFPLPLQWKTVDIFNIAPFLDGIMKQLKDNLVSGHQPQKANVTLDPDTAHHWLVLSEDCKSMRWRDENRPSSEIFGLQHVVLGCEGFTAGRHWWEVSVGDEKGWAVGVARESVRGKGHDHLILGVNVWAAGRQGDINCYFPSYLHLPLSPDNPVERIRVFLDYGGGQVFFYNADSAALLCDISGVSFFGEPLLPFFMVDVNASLTISP
ncbi:tripartite motif-containing protein 15-like isoform X2 [Hemicordylus capensis]|nr:tripartite motif-containing protein 15-like isoform X2 [Hemicordylus capensis]